MGAKTPSFWRRYCYLEKKENKREEEKTRKAGKLEGKSRWGRGWGVKRANLMNKWLLLSRTHLQDKIRQNSEETLTYESQGRRTGFEGVFARYFLGRNKITNTHKNQQIKETNKFFSFLPNKKKKKKKKKKIFSIFWIFFF